MLLDFVLRGTAGHGDTIRDYVQGATIVLVLVLGYNWCIYQPLFYLQPRPLNCHTRVQIATRDVMVNHRTRTKMLSRNCAEKLSGPWVFFVGFMFFYFFWRPF